MLFCLLGLLARLAVAQQVAEASVTELKPDVSAVEMTSAAAAGLLFRVSLRQPSGAKRLDVLQVTLTPLGSGDPDLFVAFSADQATAAAAPYKGTLPGADKVEVPASAFAAHDWAYVRVVARAPGAVSLVAAFGQEAEKLQAGVPVSGTVAKGKLARFSFQVPKDVASVEISASATEGEVSRFFLFDP